ncbi:MAG: tRNA epoxyqueuosine(34) reductase QueG [Rhodobiaceae bacterium]|nr:tRNA epoxyqueuosine(34) reductase QueG [Rhodobiaceae bacterium]
MSISISDSPETGVREGLRDAVLRRARDLGFDAAGITRPDAIPLAAGRLDGFVDAGWHGSMDWLASNREWRGNPQALWPQARSVVMLAMTYGPDHDPRGDLDRTTSGNISVYARGDDYHELVKGRLKQLGQWFAQASGADVKVFVDTAPVMEKPLAQAAGLGWQGKHTNLVSRGLGSWFFLGALFTTAQLACDAPEEDRCGSCGACLDICPTRAFPAPYQLDARRCISYLTIEYKGHIAEEFRAPMGNRIYGCDDCLAACPWNKYARAVRETRLIAREELVLPDLAYLAGLDDAAFRALFRKSPVKRTGRDRFVRNVAIAIGNSGNTNLAASARALLGDASPLVRAMAVWALRRLGAFDVLAAEAKRHMCAESDPDVLREWKTAMAEGPHDP